MKVNILKPIQHHFEERDSIEHLRRGCLTPGVFACIFKPLQEDKQKDKPLKKKVKRRESKAFREKK